MHPKMFCRNAPFLRASRGLPLCHPGRPRRAALSASSAPGGRGPRLRVTREAFLRLQTTAMASRVRTPFFVGSQAVVCFVTLVSLSGCKIAFDGETVVSPDGSVTRITRYVADGDSDKAELESQYSLPLGGAWEVRKATRHSSDTGKDYEVTISTYEVTKRYAPGEPIRPDYVRNGKTPDRVSHNETRLAAHNYVFVKVFDYNERFHDVATKEGFEISAKKLYAAWLEHFANRIAQALEDRVTLGQVREKLRVAFDPLVSRVIAGIRAEGTAFLDTNKDELEPMFEKERLISEIVKVLPPPSEVEAESWREAISQAYEKIDDVSGSLFEESGLEEQLFGVYGSVSLTTYSFRVALSLPGKILMSNATRREGNVLTWEFGPSDFLRQDYVLQARSQLVYPGRITLAVGALLAICGAWGFLALRRRSRATLKCV